MGLRNFHFIQLSEVFNTVASGSLELLLTEICLEMKIYRGELRALLSVLRVDLVFRQGSPELSHLPRAESHLDLRPERPVVLTALPWESERESDSQTSSLTLQLQENMKALWMIFSLSTLEWLR